MISSDLFDCATRVNKVIFSEYLPKYPETAINRAVYVVNVANMTKEEVEVACQNVRRINLFSIYY